MKLLHLLALALIIAATLPAESSGQTPIWRYGGTLPSRDNWAIADDSRGVVYAGGSFGPGSSYPGLFIHHTLSWGAPDTLFDHLIDAVGGAIFTMAVDSSDHLFVGTYEGVMRSSDHGGTWTFPTDTFFHSQVFGLAANARGDLLAATYRFGYYRSTDNGVTWKESNGGIEVVPASAIAVGSDGVLYGGMFDGSVFRSTDNGDTWVGVLSNTGHPVRAIAIDRRNHIFIGHEASPGKVMRSTDMGTSWTDMSNGLPPAAFLTSMVVDTIGTLYVGTIADGVFRSVDNGDTWAPYNAGMQELDVRSLALTRDGFLLAGTSKSGKIFRTIRSSYASGVGSVPQPSTSGQPAIASASYADGAIHVHYSSPAQCSPACTVFSLMGEEVAHAEGMAGDHDIRIPVEGLAPGIYYCRLSSTAYAVTRPVVITGR